VSIVFDLSLHCYRAYKTLRLKEGHLDKLVAKAPLVSVDEKLGFVR